MLNETNIFQKDKMDGKTLSAMINKKKRRAKQKYEMEHKISSAWINIKNEDFWDKKVLCCSYFSIRFLIFFK